MENSLHDLLLKNSINEAQKMGGLNQDISQDKRNYAKYENVEKTELSYYFPLRNEKNVEKLEDHLKFLEKKSGNSERELFCEMQNKDIFWEKVKMLRKDIIIYRSRITDLKIMLRELNKGVRNRIKADKLSDNINLNIEVKKKCIENIMRELFYKFNSLSSRLRNIRDESVEFKNLLFIFRVNV